MGIASRRIWRPVFAFDVVRHNSLETYKIYMKSEEDCGNTEELNLQYFFNHFLLIAENEPSTVAAGKTTNE
jgi:hypothetical protein